MPSARHSPFSVPTCALVVVLAITGAAAPCKAFTVTNCNPTAANGGGIIGRSIMVDPLQLRTSVVRSSSANLHINAGFGRRQLQHKKATPSSACSLRNSRLRRTLLSPVALPALPFDEDGPVDIPNEVDNFDAKTTVALVAGQSALVAVAIIFAAILGTSNYGLGNGFAINAQAMQSGAIATIPLFVLAYVLDFVEKGVPALQDVTKATQRSVLALLGRKRKPIIALGTALALGAAAGIGEEMLFRGVLQEALATKFGDSIAVVSSSIIFGLLHAVTPLYAALASLASFFFGFLYLQSSNLAVPIICHGLYDVGALLWAHWTVTDMSFEEQTDIIEWSGPEGGSSDDD